MERLLLRHRLFSGGWTPVLDREVMIRGPVAAVLPYDPIRDEFVLIKQFRSGAYAQGEQNPWTYEIVAGMQEPNESPEAMARREAQEECGCQIDLLVSIANFFPSPSSCSEYVSVFCGRTSTEKINGTFGIVEQGEDICPVIVPGNECEQWLSSGKLNSSIGIVGVQWLLLNRIRLREEWRSRKE